MIRKSRKITKTKNTTPYRDKEEEGTKIIKKKIIKKYILELSLRNYPHGYPIVSVNSDKKFHIICHETEQKTVTETQNVNGLIIIWSDQNLI